MVNTLEFENIKEKLSEYSLTQKAKERFMNMKPILSEAKLRQKLSETTEARKILDMLGTPPLSPVNDITKLVESADKGMLLKISELEQIRQFAVLCMRLKKYLKKTEVHGFNIALYGSGMIELDVLKEEIERCIRNERIDEQASKELKNIRRSMTVAENQIKVKLESILKSKKEYFSDSYISNRNGHFTLPVKKEYKYMVNGTVIDVSSSGATCFIEPSSISKLNEELINLETDESNEERKILYILSMTVGGFKNEILLNLDYVEELDYIFAKGKLSYDLKGIEPKITVDRNIIIKDGRHPFLPSDCVPLNIELVSPNRGIVITGPNTGGKTVALKTAGLFSIMAQCGLHLPCRGAEICMNSKVLYDIGDGQSITENLSTFSAHIKNIITIIENLDKDSLVLLDELGSGTDPTEGMGIAAAVLDELRESRCNFIVTTHYPQIKEYAKTAEGVINARMAFDKESLKPLYTLEIGEAGESCALYIAKRLGMPERMLKNAYHAAYGMNKEKSYETDKEIKDKLDYKLLIANENKSVENIGMEDNRNDYDDKRGNKKGDKKNSSIKKIEPKKPVSNHAIKFCIGDSVMVYPQKSIGIVFQTADANGEVGVQIKKQKKYVNHKRLQLKAAASKLYPENYDFSIIFDSVEVRKARHTMDKKHVDGLEIKL